MRVVLVSLLMSAAIAGCTPYIPVKDDFGTSALVPPAASGADIPPEYAEFNAYDPAVNNLLANQLCATPYQALEVQNLGAASGQLLLARGRCQTHIPIFGE
jgi:hypothetical protein